MSEAIDEAGVHIIKSKGYEVNKFPENINQEELKKIISSYDGIIVQSKTNLDRELILSGPNLKVIGKVGVGVGNIDVDTATRRGIMVMTTALSSPNASPVELTIALMMALSRNIPGTSTFVKTGTWDPRSEMMATQVAGKTIGIVGLGPTSRHVASVCQALGMETIGYDPFLSADIAIESKIEQVGLEEVFKRAVGQARTPFRLSLSLPRNARSVAPN